MKAIIALLIITSIMGIYSFIKYYLPLWLNRNKFIPLEPNPHDMTSEERLLAIIIADFMYFHSNTKPMPEAYHAKVAFEYNYGKLNDSGYEVDFYNKRKLKGLLGLNFIVGDKKAMPIFRELQTKGVIEDIMDKEWSFIGVSVIRLKETNEKYVSIVLSR